MIQRFKRVNCLEKLHADNCDDQNELFRILGKAGPMVMVEWKRLGTLARAIFRLNVYTAQKPFGWTRNVLPKYKDNK